MYLTIFRNGGNTREHDFPGGLRTANYATFKVSNHIKLFKMVITKSISFKT